ncbi:MAG: PIN domain-containing protein [Verrucomicrobiota bacterium JB022]|nr:PIN domain-containing protein [Verrucomicrobiota bacterium JB022]
MLRADFRVFLDACVLANYKVCDLLLCLAERPRQFSPHWSQEVLKETHRTQVNKLKWPTKLADHFRDQVTQTFPEGCIYGFEHIIAGLQNHPKDRHVLAAALHGHCNLILTFNLKDFRPEHLQPHGISACHPQDYLLVLYEMDAKQVISRVAAIAAKRGLSELDLLINLGKALPHFSSRLIDELGLVP